MTASNLIVLAALIVFSILCSVWDIRTKKVPVWLLAIGIAVIMILKLFESPFDILWLIVAGVAGLFYFVIRCITRGKLGMADVLFGVVQGMVLTSQHLFLCILIECGSASLVFFLLRKKLAGKTLPFIPFMAIGMIFSFIINLTLN